MSKVEMSENLRNEIKEALTYAERESQFIIGEDDLTVKFYIKPVKFMSTITVFVGIIGLNFEYVEKQFYPELYKVEVVDQVIEFLGEHLINLNEFHFHKFE